MRRETRVNRDLFVATLGYQIYLLKQIRHALRWIEQLLHLPVSALQALREDIYRALQNADLLAVQIGAPEICSGLTDIGTGVEEEPGLATV